MVEQCAGTDQRSVPELVSGLRRGDGAAWNATVRRFTPLVRRIARTYRMNGGDAEDVAQTVWLRLLEHVERIRDPAALPGWIATTARHESARLAAVRSQTWPVDEVPEFLDEVRQRCPDVDARVLRDEVVAVLRAGLDELPPARRTLLLLLVAEPPVSYREISTLLGMPIGSIGPTRARSLARLGATRPVHEYVAVA